MTKYKIGTTHLQDSDYMGYKFILNEPLIIIIIGISQIHAAEGFLEIELLKCCFLQCSFVDTLQSFRSLNKPVIFYTPSSRLQTILQSKFANKSNLSFKTVTLFVTIKIIDSKKRNIAHF